MSKATKRKHVTKEVLDDFVLPTENQVIVKVVASRGNNLHEVQTEGGEQYLVSMPTKFRKNVWIKRDDYVMVEPIEEGDKVKGEIAHILYKDQIKYIKEEGMWPRGFEDQEEVSADVMIPDDMLPPSDTDSDFEEGDMLPANPNRPTVYFEEESSSEDEGTENDQR